MKVTPVKVEYAIDPQPQHDHLLTILLDVTLSDDTHERHKLTLQHDTKGFGDARLVDLTAKKIGTFVTEHYGLVPLGPVNTSKTER